MNFFVAVVVMKKVIDDGLMVDPLRDTLVFKPGSREDAVVVHHIRVVLLMTDAQWEVSVSTQIGRTDVNKQRKRSRENKYRENIQFTVVVDHEQDFYAVWILQMVDALKGIPYIAPEYVFSSRL